MSLLLRSALLTTLLLLSLSTLRGQEWHMLNPSYSDVATPELGVIIIAGHNFASATTSAPLLRSDDGGINWRLLESGGRYGIVHLFFFSGEIGLGRNMAGAIYRTVDGGETWDTLFAASNSLQAHRFMAGNGGDTELVVVGRGIVMRSPNRGATWDSVLIDTTFSNSSGSIPTLTARGKIACIVSSSGLQRSDDGGLTWREMPHPDSSNSTPGEVLIIDSSTLVYIGPHYPLRVYRTDDAGATWRRTLYDTTAASIGSLVELTDGSLCHLSRLWPREGFLRISISRDTGRSWNAIPFPPPDELVSSFSRIAPLQNGLIAVGSSGKILKLKDGMAVWDTVAFYPYVPIPGIPGTNIGDVHAASASRWGLLGGLDPSVDADYPTRFYITEDTGATWRPARTVYEHRFAGVYFLDTMNGVGLHPCGWIVRTTDGGLTWEDTLRPQGVPDNEIGSSERWLGIAFAPEGSAGSLWNSSALYHTTNAGLSWTPVPLDTAIDSVHRIVHFDSLHAVMVGSSHPRFDSVQGRAFSDQYLYNSMDGGGSWNRIYPVSASDTTSYGDIWVQSLRLDRNEVTLIAETRQEAGPQDYTPIRHLLRSNDRGRTWGKLNAPDSLLLLNRIEHYNENDAWAVGNGIFRSSDGGRTWHRESLLYLGVPNDGAHMIRVGLRAIPSITLTPDRRTFVAPGAYALFMLGRKRLPVPILSASVPQRRRGNSSAAELRLVATGTQDNPVVEITSPGREDGELMVCDLQGRMVVSPISVDAVSGTTQMALDLRSLPSGHYRLLYRTETGTADAPLLIAR